MPYTEMLEKIMVQMSNRNTIPSNAIKMAVFFILFLLVNKEFKPPPKSFSAKIIILEIT